MAQELKLVPRDQPVVLPPDYTSLEALLGNARLASSMQILQVAAYMLRSPETDPTTTVELAGLMRDPNAQKPPMALVDNGIRYLEDHDYVARVKDVHGSGYRKFDVGPRYPLLFSTQLLYFEATRYVGLQNEMLIRDIRLDSGESRDAVMARALGALTMLDRADREQSVEPDSGQSSGNS